MQTKSLITEYFLTLSSSDLLLLKSEYDNITNNLNLTKDDFNFFILQRIKGTWHRTSSKRLVEYNLTFHDLTENHFHFIPVRSIPTKDLEFLDYLINLENTVG